MFAAQLKVLWCLQLDRLVFLVPDGRDGGRGRDREEKRGRDEGRRGGKEREGEGKRGMKERRGQREEDRREERRRGRGRELYIYQR